MGRPTIYKKGPLTAAERQRRHRKKLRREKKDAEVLAKQELNQRRLRDPIRVAKRKQYESIVSAVEDTRREMWEAFYGREPVVDAECEADEIARQVDEWMAQSPGLTIKDITAALDRRFGLQRRACAGLSRSAAGAAAPSPPGPRPATAL